MSEGVKESWRKKRGKMLGLNTRLPQESSEVNFPWTFLGATIKHLAFKIRIKKACDWIVEEEEQAGGR